MALLIVKVTNPWCKATCKEKSARRNVEGHGGY